MRKTLWCLYLFHFVLAVALAQKPTSIPSKTSLVNPFIGTGGHGHTFPGATVPFGMVQLSPDTRLNGWDACSGYHITDNTILGFSHTHLSGTGIGDYGDILMMPMSTQYYDQHGDDPKNGYASLKANGSELAAPGYYSVTLQDDNIKAELTSTTRAGFHRYSFPTGSASIIIDVSHTLQSHANVINEIEIVNDHEVRGYKVTRGWARDHHVYFHAVFSQPFSYTLVKGSTPVGSSDKKLTELGAKVMLKFESLKANQVLVKVGISSVDYDGAKNNVMQEIKHWDFDKTKSEASVAWNTWLNRIDVKGGTPDQQTIFYTALYHAGISPNLFTDWDGRYRGMDKKVHRASKESPNYTVFSLWDTFRAFHPLMTLVDPAQNESWIRAMLVKYKETGALPMWELASNETGTMIGYHAVPVIVDSYMKGYRNFDVPLAYEAIVKASTYDTTSIRFPDHEVQDGLMPKAKYYNQQFGFVPADLENESVSKALEFAYNDWCIAQMAKALNKMDDYATFTARANRYAKYFDKSIGFMRGVNKDGTWKSPFNPRFSNHRRDEYVEGNAWQWSWFVPHDVKGLIDLFGGEEPFTQKLDSLFTVSSAVDGSNSSADISGLIGQYAHGNEPSHHIAYLYNFVGQPWRTQELVDSILTALYHNDPNGLSGNEDCGQMSAWYLLSSMGIYQVAPGNPTFTFGRPLFDEVKIKLDNGKLLDVRMVNNNAQNKYVSAMRFNGKKLTTPFISYADLAKGGLLEFTMSAFPVKSLTSSVK